MTLAGKPDGGRKKRVKPAEARVARSSALSVPVPLDLRVVPAVVLAWGIAVVLLYAGAPVVAGAVVVVSVVACAMLLVCRVGGENGGGYVLPPLAGAVVAAGIGIRQTAAQCSPLTDRIGQATTTGLTLTRAPRSTRHGALTEAKIDGLPGRVTVFGDQTLLDHDQGTVLRAVVRVGESTRPNLSGVTLNIRTILDSSVPNDHVARVRDGRTDIVAALPSGPDRMIPAMVLGDERGFTDLDDTMMVDSGLAHLSAVSGANVALILGATMWALAWAGPRARVIGGAVALAGFVAVVGTEPSVLRAMMTGIVGLIAVIASRRRNAVPALACGIVILLVAVPELALAPGFMLSVAATAGLIVVVAPVTGRLLTVPTVARWPAPLVRAISVTLVAHIATVPVLALIIGRVSHVSVVANLIAAPAVAPVTVFGTAAAVFVFLGLTPVAVALVWAASPFAWWVHAVGSLCAQFPGAASGMGLLGVLVSLGIGVLFFRFPTSTSLTILLSTTGIALALVVGLHIPQAPPGGISAVCPGKGNPTSGETGEVLVFPSPAQAPDRRCGRVVGAMHSGEVDTVVVEDLSAAHELAGRPDSPDWIVVRDCGDRSRRWIVTPDGIPVVCPFRDGPQVMYPDGTVWGSSGTMEP